MGESLGERVGLRDLVRIDDVAHVSGGEPLDSRRLGGVLAPVGASIAGLAIA